MTPVSSHCRGVDGSFRACISEIHQYHAGCAVPAHVTAHAQTRDKPSAKQGLRHWRRPAYLVHAQSARIPEFCRAPTTGPPVRSPLHAGRRFPLYVKQRGQAPPVAARTNESMRYTREHYEFLTCAEHSYVRPSRSVHVRLVCFYRRRCLFNYICIIRIQGTCTFRKQVRLSAS